MHAEASRPVALGRQRQRCASRSRTDRVSDGARRHPHALDLSVGDVETEIGARIQVELGARTDVPSRPVVVATSRRHSRRADETIARNNT